MTSRNRIAAAIDVGYGHTKFSCRVAGGTSEPIAQGRFPSLAVLASTNDDLMKSMQDERRDQLTLITVGTRQFWVGTDTPQLAGAHTARNRTSNYPETDEHLALALGALWRMKKDHVHELVVGLPLTTLHASRETLRKRLEGRHTLPGFNGGQPTEIQVDTVRVVPQPMGTLLAMANKEPALLTDTVLVLDIGFHTLDAYVADALRPVYGRSVAIEGGMASFYEGMQAALVEQVRKVTGNARMDVPIKLEVFERAVSEGQASLKILGGREFEVGPLMTAAQARFDAFLQQVAAKAGGFADLSHVVITGGGARLLAEAFTRLNPHMAQPLQPDDPAFANVRGYLLLAERYAAEPLTLAKAA